MLKRFLSLATCALALVMFAQTSIASVFNTSYFTSGGAAAAGAQPYNDSVVSLFVTDNTGETHFLSGVYLGGAVLTAGHATDFGNGVYATSILVRTGNNVFASPLESATSTSYLTHPNYNPALGVGHSTDLSLVYVTLNTATPAVLATSLPGAGATVEYCGFGLPYNLNGTPLNPFDNSTRFGGRNVLRAADPLYPGYLQTLWREQIVGGFLDEYGGSPGDSGGSLWSIDNGQRSLIGSITFGTGVRTGSRTYSQNVVSENVWITTHIPTPGAIALFIVGGLVATRRKRVAI